MTWRDREQKLGARLGRLPPLRQGMLGGDRDVGNAKQRVGAGGEDFQHALASLAVLVALGQREMNLHPEALADPIALHGLHPLGPAGQVVESVQ